MIQRSQNMSVLQSTEKTVPMVIIFAMRIFVFIKIAYLLHFMAIGAAFLSFHAGHYAFVLFSQGDRFYSFLMVFASAYAFTLPFFAELDARSRYQNYKIIKDKLYIYGYQQRLLKPFLYSRCQRDAIQVAANDLDYGTECQAFFYHQGFRWYHIMPRILLMYPKTILTKKYWKQTLFVKYYKLKYFLW